MYAKASATLFLNVIFLLTCTGAFAETSCRLDTKQGIGALGRIEPRSRVIKVSHNAGPEGARVAQLLFQEADSVQAGEKLVVLSDHVKRKAEVQAAGTRIKVLEAQRAVEQVALTFNKKEHLRHQSLDPGAVSISLVDEKRLAYEQSLADLKRLSAEITRAQAEQKIAEAELDNTLITAPITGTVVKIFARQGERIGDNELLQIALIKLIFWRNNFSCAIKTCHTDRAV